MKFYLAGKISKRDWRESIVGGFHGEEGQRDWTEIRRYLGNGHVYVGPFFVGCDHGCAHTVAEHAMPPGSEFYCVGAREDEPVPDPETGAPPDPRKWKAPAPDIASGENELITSHRVLLLERCMRAIDDADLVFAWLTDTTAFGTLWELGYARGRGIQTAVGIPHGLDLSDLWLPIYGAGVILRACSPSEAFVRATSKFSRLVLFNKCESPIERQYLAALSNIIPGDVELTVQHQACGYRLDFALQRSGVKVGVECDGHNYHERTKEQARHDKSRDRKLTAAGWRMLRFTGSEIYANAERCAVETVEALAQLGKEAPLEIRP